MELLVRGGFERNHDEVAYADLLGIPGRSRLDMKIALRTEHADTSAADDFVIRPQQEMNVLPVTMQLGTVKTAQSTATHHADLHSPNEKGTLTNQSAFKKNKKLLGAEDRVLRGFGNTEFHDPFGRNLNRFTRRGISPDARFPIYQYKFA